MLYNEMILWFQRSYHSQW